MTNNSPEVSVVVIAFNEEAGIVACVRALINQETALPYEVVVVDDGSTDATVSRVKALASTNKNIRLVELGSNRGRGAARQCGVEHARGCRIAFVDADVVVPRDWLARLLVVADQWAAASGIAVPDGDCAYLHRRFRLESRRRRGSRAITGNNVLFAPGVVERFTFNAADRLGEDFRLANRLVEAGLAIGTVDDLYVSHEENKSYLASMRWMWDSGRDASHLLFEYGEIRGPDLAWFLWSASALPILFARRSRHILLFVGASVVVAVAHSATRFQLRPKPARWILASVVDVSLVSSYLAGRTWSAVTLLLAARQRESAAYARAPMP